MLYLSPLMLQVIYVETISNPLLCVPNIPVVVALARKHGLVSVIDNTFASPVCFRLVGTVCMLLLQLT